MQCWNAERSEAIERHEVPLELFNAAVRLSNAAAQRSRISLRSIFNPSFADFNRCPDFFIEHCEAVLEC
jgi:hypothetical protein